MYSIDTGAFLERETHFVQHTFLHTLEPRLYYLRVPYRDQNNLPLFDTSTFDFSFSQLFRENRFSGADRIGDADQLSVAVTSRLIDEDRGREWLSGSLGQIIYLADRQVTLGGPHSRPSRPPISWPKPSTHFSRALVVESRRAVEPRYPQDRSRATSSFNITWMNGGS